MKRERRFMVGAVGVALVVSYLMVTGMRDAMVYYHTPSELSARVAQDPGYRSLGLKVGGEVVPGTVSFDQRTLDLRFDVVDAGGGVVNLPVHYRGPVPDTFEEGGEVVVEGRLTEAGLFEATILLTKCGSRYEAVEDDLRGAPGDYGASAKR